MANFCTNCGISLPNDIKFCTDCGNKIEQDISVENKAEKIKEVENRSEISQDVNEIANNEGEIAENKRQISPTKSIENTSTGIDPKYIIIGIVALLIIGAVYTMRTSTSSSDNSNPGDIIKQPIQKSIQKSPERTVQKRTVQKAKPKKSKPKKSKPKKSKPKIASTRIGNLEVALNDLPDEMNWEKAKAECAKLGGGWRLPTKTELNILYLNKDKIGGFKHKSSYWSSTEHDHAMTSLKGKLAWSQAFFVDNFISGHMKNKPIRVRMVRSF